MPMRPRTSSQTYHPSGSGHALAYSAQPRPSLHALVSSPRTLLLPSVRLRSALYALSLLILALILLALNAASLSSGSRLSSDAVSLNTAPTGGGLADSLPGKKEAEGKDAIVKEEELQRSFEEPDYALLSGMQPSEIGCDVPLAGDGAPAAEEGKLVFLGIFSAGDKKERRDL